MGADDRFGYLAAGAVQLHAIAGTVTAAVMLIRDRKGPWSIVKDISWGVLPLVAGLFVLVEALDKTGVIGNNAALTRGEPCHYQWRAPN